MSALGFKLVEKTYLESFPYRTDLKIYFSGFLTSYCRFSFEANGCRVVFSVNVAGLLFANAVGIFVTSILGKSDKWKFYFSMIRTIKRLLSTFYQLKINDSLHFMLKLHLQNRPAALSEENQPNYAQI